MAKLHVLLLNSLLAGGRNMTASIFYVLSYFHCHFYASYIYRSRHATLALHHLYAAVFKLHDAPFHTDLALVAL